MHVGYIITDRDHGVRRKLYELLIRADQPFIGTPYNERFTVFCRGGACLTIIIPYKSVILPKTIEDKQFKQITFEELQVALKSHFLIERR